MSQSEAFLGAIKLAEEMAELLEVAAIDEDVKLSLDTVRDAKPESLLTWALVQRLILQGWSFSYSGKDDWARGGAVTHDPNADGVQR